MYDYGARWYDPQIGRWINPDPIIPNPANPQSFNRFTYVLGNPIKYTDPSGHCVFGLDTVVCVGIALAGLALIVSTDQPINDEIVAAEAAEGKTDYRDTYPSDIQGAIGLSMMAIPFAGEVMANGGTIACADGDCTNEVRTAANTAQRSGATEQLGKLKHVSQNIWESTAGLRYGPDPRFGNRVQHVMNHTTDKVNRAVHGVFNSRTEALNLIDEAWQTIQQNGIKGIEEGTRTVYTVDMGRTIGYVGGQAGASAGYPNASHLQLVIALPLTAKFLSHN